MSIATKNGSLIVKDGQLAENCDCCGGSCGCPSWCGYKMILSNPDTCPGPVYGNSSIGFPDCSSPVPAYVESPFTCSTASQTASASVKGGASYQVNGQYIFFSPNPGLVVAPDDVWSVQYPVLRGTVSGGISSTIGLASGRIDARRYTNSWSASVQPFCRVGSGQATIQIELSYTTSISTFDIEYLFAPPYERVRLVGSLTQNRSKIVTFNTTCVSDSRKWCFGEVEKQFKPFPNPCTGWFNVNETSYGDWDVSSTTPSGDYQLRYSPIAHTVNFQIVSRESCNELP